MSIKKKVVVVGGGFAGIRLIQDLDPEQFDVLLLDRVNHHQFQPLFYQVATSQLEPSSISFPLRSIFRDRANVRIRLGTATGVDDSRKVLLTDIGEFPYDILVLAQGCSTNFYGNAEMAENALPLKSTYDAITIRNHLLLTLEKALYCAESERSGLLTFVVVGAGPTGVEMAGALAEIRRDVLPRDYRFINFSQMRVLLVEGGPSTLAAMSPQAQNASAHYLQDMGVTLLSGTTVKRFDGKQMILSTGETLATSTVIWAAGVTGNALSGLPPEAAAPGNRIRVNRHSRAEGASDIFALGDIALMSTPKYPKGHPQLANVAINQGAVLARNLNRQAKGKAWKEYEYRDLGSMATVGRNKAVVDLPFIQFKGYLAWAVWMSLHLMLILSVKNKLIIFINWAWAYVTKDTSLRLILTGNPRPKV
jgi:NADH:ubiquinone reductase (H+-translocating)